MVRWGRTSIVGDVQTVTEATGQTTLARLASLYTGTVATAASSVTSATVYHLPSRGRQLESGVRPTVLRWFHVFQRQRIPFWTENPFFGAFNVPAFNVPAFPSLYFNFAQFQPPLGTVQNCSIQTPIVVTSRDVTLI